MASPCKNSANIEKCEIHFDSTKSKVSRQEPISQKERLRLKTANATLFPVPVMKEDLIAN